MRIHSDNIVSGVGHNFAKLDYVKTTPYDYYSIMHYGVKDYTTDKSKKTIEILNSAIDTSNVGTKRRLSKFDIAWANKLYSCEGELLLFAVLMGCMHSISVIISGWLMNGLHESHQSE